MEHAICESFPCTTPYVKCMPASFALVKLCMLLEIHSKVQISKKLHLTVLNSIVYFLASPFPHPRSYTKSDCPLSAFTFLTLSFETPCIFRLYVYTFLFIRVFTFEKRSSYNLHLRNMIVYTEIITSTGCVILGVSKVICN